MHAVFELNYFVNELIRFLNQTVCGKFMMKVIFFSLCHNMMYDCKAVVYFYFSGLYNVYAMNARNTRLS